MILRIARIDNGNSEQTKANTMRKIFNFNAGPAMLPEEVLLQAQAEMLDWQGTGSSIMELGHRSPEFKIVAEQAEADLRELMSIPKNYQFFLNRDFAELVFDTPVYCSAAKTRGFHARSSSDFGKARQLRC